MTRWQRRNKKNTNATHKWKPTFAPQNLRAQTQIISGYSQMFRSCQLYEDSELQQPFSVQCPKPNTKQGTDLICLTIGVKPRNCRVTIVNILTAQFGHLKIMKCSIIPVTPSTKMGVSKWGQSPNPQNWSSFSRKPTVHQWDFKGPSIFDHQTAV